MLNDSKTLYYKKPAKSWNEALPLGNGSLGAMIFGDTTEEKIAMNSDTLWSGFPRKSNAKPTSYNAFKKARDLTLNGSYEKAQSIIENEFLANCSQAYLPLCHIKYKFKKLCFPKNYSRVLDLETGIHKTEYSKNGLNFNRESFVAYNKNAFIDNIKCESGENFDLKITLTTQLKGICFNKDEFLILDGTCPSDSKYNVDTYAGMKGDLYPDDEKLKGMSFRCAIKVNTDGDVSFLNDYMNIKNASNIEVVFCTENSFNGYDKHPNLEGKEYKISCLNHLKKISDIPFVDLKSEQINAFSSYFNRVEIDLGSNNKGNVPTNIRLKEHHKGEKDLALYTLIFNFGRYLIISSSKEGTQATNLQGIWNDNPTPPWSSNYTTNINTEMNYWPVLPCNLEEFNEPLIHLIKDISVKGEETAKTLYGANGFCAHHNIDLWRFTDPADGKAQWGFWPMSGGWFCEHLFNHYLYTMDEIFLKDTAFPIMKKSCEFFLSILTKDKDGYYICCPAVSPENLYEINGKKISISETTTMTMSIIKELFSNTLKASEILNYNDKIIDEIKEKIADLYPIKIGSQGQILEWYKEHKEVEPNHRHKSHLYGLHPANLITPDETPELASACRKSLELRGDNGTGWSLAWKINMWARLWDGDHALKLLDMQLRPIKSTAMFAGGGTYPNLFDGHPPFQIDGNFGCTSGICEMLLQSRENKIFLLPALPSSFKKGYVKGLKAMGNITVDIYWEDEKIIDYKLQGNTENKEIYCQNIRIK